MGEAMISVRRWAATLIPFVYLAYLPVQSVLLPGFSSRTSEILALLIYFLVGIPTLLLFRGIRIPIWLAAINLVAAVLIPWLIINQRVSVGNTDIGAWEVMGITVVMTATAVRQHPWFAVIGLVSLIAQEVYSYGALSFLTHGLAGATVFVMAGLGVSRGIRTANSASDKFREQEAASLAGIAALEATQTARTERLQQILSSAVPMLNEIAKSDEPLNSETKEQTKLLELSLRDEIRGRGLLTPELRTEVERLRRLGCEVAVLDEGGLDDISKAELDSLLSKAIPELKIVTEGRVTIRSPKAESFKLTVVATIPGVAKPVVNIKL
jgi:hypothetical protein